MTLRLQSFTRIKGFLLKELVHRDCVPWLAQPVPQLSRVPCSDLSASLAALNITGVQTPGRTHVPAPLPPPLPMSREIWLPQNESNSHSHEDGPVSPALPVEEPTTGQNPEPKQAARLIIIRKKKMQRHKLRKLRKKMKFEWAKRRQQRELLKEKAFQAEVMAHLKRAMAFDPAQYARDKIARAKEVELPKVWHGVPYPENIIKQLMAEEEAKRKQKIDNEKRRASMSQYVRDYLVNLPRK